MTENEKHLLPPGFTQEWYETGHINTTLIIARLAGVQDHLAQQIAIYCQLPDYFKMTYSAGTPLWAWISGKGKDAEVISKILHGFHGGAQAEVERRQRFFRDLVRDQIMRQEDVWKIGFTVHAFGDSYAHTFLDEAGQRSAYGYPMGHGLDFLFCVKPDHISKHPDLYMDYCAALFWALCGEKAQDSVEFAGFEGGFRAVRMHRNYVQGTAGEKESIVSDFIIRGSCDRTKHADMKAAMAALDYDEVIGFLEGVGAQLTR